MKKMQLPFRMTYFNIDPKPVNFIHPNGIKRIKERFLRNEGRVDTNY